MRRREFIAALGGAAVWPLAASAQQPVMQVVGFVSGRSLGSDALLVEGFRRGVRESGFIDRQNVTLEFRWADKLALFREDIRQAAARTSPRVRFERGGLGSRHVRV